MIRLFLVALLVLATVGLIAPIVCMPTCRLTIENRLMFELSYLQNALDHYEAWYGQALPEQKDKGLFRHLRQRYPTLRITPELLEAINITEVGLDDAERLVLFLGGKLDDALDVPPNAIFEFTGSRLVDRDSDGWYEYVSTENNPYELRRGQPVVFCTKLGVWLTSPLKD